MIVLTSSRRDEDLIAAYDLHTNGYLEKPLDMDQYVQMLDAVISLWARTMRVPALEE
ncbi:MAG: hypothetical protein KatS3mg115_0801 [Candidatus Poribacteria bacterium]|nr:MAG: hypothetical protein KatS3mg115_0801 [Candidatus Poribacteria bacterium]